MSSPAKPSSRAATTRTPSPRSPPTKSPSPARSSPSSSPTPKRSPPTPPRSSRSATNPPTPPPTFSSPGAREIKPKALGEPELSAGDPGAAFPHAAALVDAWYETPAQHHNPLELFQCTCAWAPDGTLTVHESSQNVRGYRSGLANALGIKPTQIRVLSPFAGGAFGSRGELGPHTPLIAFAARKLGRPVKFVSTREQSFTLRTFRAETRHHLRLAADHAGNLTALDHESWELTARDSGFATAGSDSTSRLYRVANVRTLVHNIEADRQEPGFMRAPPEVPYLFAMESAMDELAFKLSIDPLDLRRLNDTMVELVTNKPYTSRSLVQCINHGAELFGWSARTPAPRSMATEHELIGYGYATAFYPTQVGPAECTVTLYPDLTVKLELATHEIGNGVRTVLAQTAAEFLGLPTRVHRRPHRRLLPARHPARRRLQLHRLLLHRRRARLPEAPRTPCHRRRSPQVPLHGQAKPHPSAAKLHPHRRLHH